MNNHEKNLTLLLLTKDRFEFSKRWLEFAISSKQQFPILIADGSIHDLLRREVQTSATHLDIDYLYQGPDLTISHFISKTIRSLKSIRTKYTFMASDDDFFSSGVLTKSMNFLESNRDFVLCNGGALDFGLSARPTLENSIFGQIRYVRRFGLYESFLEDDIVNRINRYRKTNRSYWHSVITTDSLLRSWEIASELELTRYDTLETFLNLYWLTQGKFMNLDNEILLFHQVHNNMISQTLETNHVRESNEIWKLETRRIEDYINSVSGVDSFSYSSGDSMEEYAKRKDHNKILPTRKYFMVISILYKKIRYKIDEKFGIEPKMVLSDLYLSEFVISQIKDIERFLISGKMATSARRFETE